MTIAACHVSPEGVIFGTDSTSTVTALRRGLPPKTYHLDYEQKLFELGPPQQSTLGLATWGQGRIGNTAHRTIAARLARHHANTPFVSVEAAAEHLASMVWQELAAYYGAALARALELFEQAASGRQLTQEEWDHVVRWNDLINGGYFIGGRVESAAECSAFEVSWSIQNRAAVVAPLAREAPNFRGVPQMMQRLIHGYDQDLAQRVFASGKWQGTEEELLETLEQGELILPHLLPLREAIDWIHTVIHTTIRAIKFAGWHWCGGPVEIGVITTDRPFRWVCHKRLDAAIIVAQDGSRYDG